VLLLASIDWQWLRPRAERMLALRQSADRTEAFQRLLTRARTAYHYWLQNPLVNSEIISSCPSPNWITTHPRVKELLQRHAEEHTDDIVYKMSFEPPTGLFNLFSVITKTRQDEVSKFFHDALPLSHRLAGPMSSLKLATSVFRSRRSWVFGLHYPDLGFYDLGRPSAEDDFYDHPSPWPSEEWWEFDAFGSQLIHQILIACRLDPATTTISDLETLDPRVVCKTCSPPESDYGPTMTWRRALLHWDRSHKQTPSSQAIWRVLNPWEKSVFLEDLGIDALESQPMPNTAWLCGLCPWYIARSHRMHDHDHEQLLVRNPCIGFGYFEPDEIVWVPRRSVGVRDSR